MSDTTLSRDELVELAEAGDVEAAAELEQLEEPLPEEATAPDPDPELEEARAELEAAESVAEKALAEGRIGSPSAGRPRPVFPKVYPGSQIAVNADGGSEVVTVFNTHGKGVVSLEDGRRFRPADYRLIEDDGAEDNA